MDFPFINFRWLAAAVMAWAMLLPAHAQQSGQSIIFSSPQNDEASANAPALTPPAGALPNFPSAPSGLPGMNFNPPSGAEEFPRPQMISPSERWRLQQLQQDKKNWMLLTPAEILGVNTPEKILGVTERDASGQEKRLTPLERYWNRQNEAHTPVTNAFQMGGSLGRWDLPGQAEANGANPPVLRGLDTKSIWDKLMNSAPDAAAAEAARQNQNGASVWQKLLGDTPPEPMKAPSPAKLAAAARFQQLLGATAPSAAPPATRATYSSRSITSDPIFGEQKINPAGASYTPLSSGIGVPMGVAPLPGIVTAPLPAAIATPAWAPQLPPWQSGKSDMFAVPQRKF